MHESYVQKTPFAKEYFVKEKEDFFQKGILEGKLYKPE